MTIDMLYFLQLQVLLWSHRFSSEQQPRPPQERSDVIIELLLQHFHKRQNDLTTQAKQTVEILEGWQAVVVSELSIKKVDL